MTARTFQWTPLAQARRIAAMDIRLTAIDMAFGLVYVLAGFFIFTDASQPVHVMVYPIVVLSGVLVYLTERICGPEGNHATAMFFANLPRSRSLAYWTHAATLGAFALAMEAVIGMGMALRVHAWLPDQQFIVTPFGMVLPFFAITCGLFKASHFHFVTFHIYVYLFIGVVSVVSFFVFMITISAEFDLSDGIGKSWPILFLVHFGPGLTLAALTIFLLGFGYRRWMNIQMGEMS